MNQGRKIRNARTSEFSALNEEGKTEKMINTLRLAESEAASHVDICRRVFGQKGQYGQIPMVRTCLYQEQKRKPEGLR